MGLPTPRTVSIVAGGRSVLEADLAEVYKRTWVLGVNDSAVHAPCHAALSMDGRWMAHRWQWLRRQPILSWLRRVSFVKHVGEVNAWPGLQLFENDYRQSLLSGTPGTLDGQNSGACALNLAYQLRPAEVYLFGFDMKVHEGRGHWYPEYEWVGRAAGRTSQLRFDEWKDAFMLAAVQLQQAGIKVYNVSTISGLQAFPKLCFGDFIEQTREGGAHA